MIKAVKKTAFILLLMTFILGCAQTNQLPIVRYELQLPEQAKKVSKWDEDFYVYDRPEYRLSLAVFEHGGLIVIPIEIDSKSKERIEPDQYFIQLYDGRDKLPIKVITRQDLEAIKNKSSGGPGLNLLSPSLQGALGAFNSIVNYPETSALAQELDKAISLYFAFRPIYPYETRKGFLAFYHDFELEYPLTLYVKIKGEEAAFFFVPMASTPEK